MTIAITPEQLALRDAVRAWAERTGSRAAARASGDAAREGSPVAGLSESWGGLAALGVFGIHVPEEYGGAGQSAEDLAVAVEELGYALAPEAFWPTALAGLCLLEELRRGGESPAVKTLLPELAEGAAAAVVVAAGEPAIGAAGARYLVVPVPDDVGGYAVLDADAPGVTVTVRRGTDPTRSIADVDITSATIPDDRRLPTLTSARVRDLGVALAAAEAAGVAGWCVDTAVAYAKVREQFGRTIGSFQAIKHLCADMLARVELARAAAWDAAVAIADDDPDQLSIAAAVAGAVALDAAVDTAKDCIQVHGGIGFTWEHDAHFALRRVVTLRQLFGPTTAWRERATALTRDGVRRHLHLDLAEHEETVAAERAAVREALAGVSGLAAEEQRRRLAPSGFLTPHWPRPWGRDAGAAEQLAIAEEFAAAGVKQPDLVIGGWAVPTIIAHGTDEQRERFVVPTLAGDIRWCQMFSEPGAGSDLASLRTKATKVEGGWRLDGQKVWTSTAQYADWAICLARSNPEAEAHAGITYFLVDMKTPGLDVRPLREITGHTLFNEIFLDGVFVPDENVVGEVDRGWVLARTTLANERVGMASGSSMGGGVESLLAIADSVGAGEDPLVRDRLGDLITRGQAQTLLGLRATLRQLSGTDPGAVSSVRKLVGMHHTQDVREFALELMGPAGAVEEDAPAEKVFAFLMTRQLTIAGGTSQVLRNVIGERILGLPRDDIRR